MKKVVKQLYERSTYFIYEILTKLKSSKCKGGYFLNKKMLERKRELQCLNPTQDIQQVEKNYIYRKISICFAVFLGGCFVILCSFLSGINGGCLSNGSFIERKTYGKGDLNTTLMAKVIDEKTHMEEIKVLVNERRYSEEQLEELYENFTKKLEEILIGENESLSNICQDMKLPTYINEFPFRVVWETSDYTLINADGTLGERNPSENGEEVQLTANISYFDWKREFRKKIVRYPLVRTEEQEWKDMIEKAVTEQNENSLTVAKLELPMQIGGKEVEWKEIRENKVLELCILLVIVIAVVSLSMDKELHMKIEERKKEMIADYPEIVGKLSLLIGAGMPMRKAWQRITNDYLINNKGNRRYAYEEMKITFREMESGISESKSYDNFAKRCQIQCYMRLGTLLSQNLKKGSSNIQAMLQTESKMAFDEKKAHARKAGEEAGTKLLLPMMMMLGVVMIVIMVPAFLSFSI